MEVKNQNIMMQQVLFLLLLIGLASLFIRELSFFVSSFLGAITCNVLLKRPFSTMVNRWKWPKGLSAISLMIAVSLVLTAILWLLFNQIVIKLSEIENIQITEGIDVIRQKAKEITGYNIIPEDIITKTATALTNIVTDVFNMTYSVIANLFMMFFVLYFMMTADDSYKNIFTDFLPLSDENRKMLTNESFNMIYANSIGIPLMMTVQGCFAIVGYLIFGVGNPFFWGILTGFFSIIPIVGTTVIWLPLSIYMIATGYTWMGIGLLAYGGLVITNVDNLFRFILMKKIADVHPLITVLGVIFGLSLFGFWGIIFGPSLLSVFLLLLKTYRSEYIDTNVPVSETIPVEEIEDKEVERNTPES
ncbi:MAG: AI-2E family transporter [Bacteroidales bacterium]|nr:AI-2E family transporter [Bacteroidales bacterium]MDD3162096.1 AI-2E family transporter [Bacteroidales bacterium]